MSEARGVRVTAVKDWAQFAMLVFATAWGVYTFVFKETILPARRPATLTVTAKLEELGRHDSRILMRLRIHAVNRTDRKVYVPALWYSVRGLQLASQEDEIDAYRARIESRPNAEVQARYSAVAGADVVAVGAILSEVTSFYEPTDETTNEVLFEVPADYYDALETRAEFFVTKEIDGLSLAEWNVGPDGALAPKILLAGRQYDPTYDQQHFAWATRVGAGFNWATATHSLWPRSENESSLSDSETLAAKPDDSLQR
jgi:hypothetical protein